MTDEQLDMTVDIDLDEILQMAEDALEENPDRIGDLAFAVLVDIPLLVAELRTSRARMAELEAVRIAAEARRDWWNGGADGDVDSEVLSANLCEALDNVGEPPR